MGTKTQHPQKKSDFDPNFRTQVDEHVRQAKKDYDNRHVAKWVPWLMPVKNDWSGSLFDWEGMKSPFNRREANQMFVEATQDVKDPGKSGDLVITTTQIDYLAVMERAFRARHCYSFPRCVAHTLGRRRYGHGGDKGTFKLGAIQYVKSLIKRTGLKA